MTPFLWVSLLVIVFVVANIWASRRWMRAFVEAHRGISPATFGWVTTRDSDPTVERTRRIRLLVVAGELAAFLALLYVSANDIR